VFLLRNENTAIANVAPINTKQHGGANNEKLQLETLVRSVGANLQAVNSQSIVYTLKKTETIRLKS